MGKGSAVRKLLAVGICCMFALGLGLGMAQASRYELAEAVSQGIVTLDVSGSTWGGPGSVMAVAATPGLQPAWNPKEKARLKVESDSIRLVAFSPDGHTLAAGSFGALVRDASKGWVKLPSRGFRGGRVYLWDVPSGRPLGESGKHEGWVTGLLFPLDGHTLVSAAGGERISTSFFSSGQWRSAGGEVYFWDLAAEGPFVTRKEHTESVSELALSPNGTVVASASRDKTIRLWDVASRQSTGTLSGHTGCVYALAFSPDGRLLASASWDRTVRLWDVATQQAVATMKGHKDDVTCVAFHPNGEILVSASRDGTLRLWDVSSAQPVAVIEGPKKTVFRVASPLLGILSARKQSVPQIISSIAFSPDGRFLACISEDPIVWVWEVASRQVVATLEGHTDDVNTIAFSPDGGLFASGSDDKSVRLWDVRTWQTTAILAGTGRVLDLAFSPDGRLLVSGTLDGTVHIWDLSDSAGH